MKRPYVLVTGVVAAGIVAAGLLTNAWAESRDTAWLEPATADPERSASAPTPAPKGTVTLTFGGDVHFENQVVAQVGPGGLAGMSDLFRGSELTMLNLESAVTNRGTPVPGKEFAFRVSPQALDRLREQGVDVLSLANNHSFDYGTTGLSDTLNAQDQASPPIVGIGRTLADAVSPWTTTIKNTSFAIFAAMNSEPLADEKNPAALTASWQATPSQAGMVILPEHQTEFLAAVRQAAREVDVVVVYMHWGVEYAACPSPAQRALARQLAKAGADVVVGAHSHRNQGVGFLGKTAVSYGLGNFIWYHDDMGPSYVMRVKVTDGKVSKVSAEPIEIGKDGIPRAAAPAVAAETMARIRDINACAGLSSSPR